MDAPDIFHHRNSRLAGASLVLGLAGLVTGFLTGIPAIVLGHAARARIRQRRLLHGGGRALAGLVLGYTATFGSLLVILAVSALGSFADDDPESARQAEAELMLREIIGELEVYRERTGCYPSNGQGLEALVREPEGEPVPRRWRQHYRQLPLDPWGRPFFYTRMDSGAIGSFTVSSLGADGLPGTTDDRTETVFP